MIPKVKVCGITRKEDALLASSLGATALGFVFAPSSRQVSNTQAAAIISQLTDEILPVGVFVNPDLKTLLQTIEDTQIKAVQLHGQETPQFVSQLKNQYPNILIFKAIGVKDQGLDSDPGSFQDCDFFLFDSTAPRNAGGLRPLLSWKVLKGLQFPHPFYVAGGLRADNMVEVIRELRPFGVDVSSGVESQPGEKNATKMKSFFAMLGECHV